MAAEAIAGREGPIEARPDRPGAPRGGSPSGTEQTARALENFQLSGVAINHYPGFVEAWAIVKLAAARANTDVGAMKPERLALIEKVCQAVMDGKYHEELAFLLG